MTSLSRRCGETQFTQRVSIHMVLVLLFCVGMNSIATVFAEQTTNWHAAMRSAIDLLQTGAQGQAEEEALVTLRLAAERGALPAAYWGLAVHALGNFLPYDNGTDSSFDWLLNLAQRSEALSPAGLPTRPIHISKAVVHLEAAARLGHISATNMLSLLFQRNTRADQAPITASSKRQSMLAQLFAEISSSQPSALPESPFIGVATSNPPVLPLGGIILAGYRHLHGLDGSILSCNVAANFYHTAAERIIQSRAELASFSPRIKLGNEMVRLEQEYSRGHGNRDKTPDEDVVQYYKYFADMGDVEASVTMGIVYLVGTPTHPRNFERALHYFRHAAEASEEQRLQGSHVGSKNAHSGSVSGVGDPAAKAYLGFMYQNGYGVPQHNKTALRFYRDAARDGNGYAYAMLGRMYLHGWSVQQSARNAFKYFTQSAETQNAEGLLQLGLMNLHGVGTKRDYAKAQLYFSRAAQQGNIVALYNLAQMMHAGLGVPRQCKSAVLQYKKVVESTTFVPLAQLAYHFYAQGNMQHATLIYDILAALGFELAQINAAWMYTMGLADSDLGPDQSARNHSTYLYKLAAQQGSAEAHVKLGDIYYTDSDSNRSAACYWVASDLRHPQAAFNLAWMFQRGEGSLPKDHHLAKRYYDLAASINNDAYVPSKLALVSLAIDYIIHLDHRTLLEQVLPFLGWDTPVIVIGIGLSLVFILLRLSLFR